MPLIDIQILAVADSLSSKIQYEGRVENNYARSLGTSCYVYRLFFCKPIINNVCVDQQYLINYLPFETNVQGHIQRLGTKEQDLSPMGGSEHTLQLFGDHQQSDLLTTQRIHG